MTIIRTQKRSPHRSFDQHFSDAFDSPVLVIEDQKSLAGLLAAMIRERWGCEVHLAHSLEQTARLLSTQDPPYRVAVCDLNLPDAPYGEVIELVKSAGIAAIALTGTFGEDLREAILKKGVIDYVPKDSTNSFGYVTDLVGRLQKNFHIKLLVVDDSLSARAVLKHILEMLRFTVFTANDGAEALTVLDAHPDIAMMLTDYAMPVMDGFELTAQARKRHGKERLAIIGISASDDKLISSQFLKNGANDFITKPYSYEEILCRINQNLEMLEIIRINRDAATRDYLTRLYNRRYFFETGSPIHAAAKSRQHPLAAAMLDIDHFKKINDQHGHDCGDEVLRQVAQLLDQHLGQWLVARLGGEEFAVLLDGCGPEEAHGHLEALRQAIAAAPIACGDRVIPVTLSVGLSSEPGESIDDMIKSADLALYQAKKGGRNRVVAG
jgi:diguanylate cyclase (GGDEF)-like protein